MALDVVKQLVQDKVYGGPKLCADTVEWVLGTNPVDTRSCPQPLPATRACARVLTVTHWPVHQANAARYRLSSRKRLLRCGCKLTTIDFKALD